MLSTLPSYTYSVASSPLCDLFDAAGGLPLPDTYEALERFIRADQSRCKSSAGTPRRELAKRILKILGGKYVGRVALWLYHQFLTSAPTVLSHPRSPALAVSQPLLLVEAQSLTAPKLPAMHTALDQAELCSRSRPARSLRQLKTKTPSRPPQAVKRKSSSDCCGSVVFECVQHKKVFAGKYAENSYRRHLKRTKEHGCTPFKCHMCDAAIPRIDHFKNHMRKWHQLSVRGRSGEYTFESITEAVDVVELEGSAGTAADNFMELPAW